MDPLIRAYLAKCFRWSQLLDAGLRVEDRESTAIACEVSGMRERMSDEQYAEAFRLRVEAITAGQ